MNTYAEQPQYADFGDRGPMGPVRTSSLAIASLILGIVCLPGLGVLAVLLGVVAMFAIRASAGRVSGAGLAAGGIVLGLIATTLWVLAVFGFSQFAKLGANSADRMLTAIEARDLDSLRDELAPESAAMLSQDRLDAFAAELNAKLGAADQSAGSIGAMVSQLGGLQPAQDRVGKPRLTAEMTMFPVPMEFENGRALATIIIDVRSGDIFNNGLKGTVVNLAISTNDGFSAWLLDQDAVADRLMSRGTPPQSPGEPDPNAPDPDPDNPDPDNPAPADPDTGDPDGDG